MDTEAAANRVLDRYVAVWIWSVLFGTSTGLLFSLSNINARPWGSLGLPIALFSVLALFMAFASWQALYRALRHHILPQFFPKDFPREIENQEHTYGFGNSDNWAVIPVPQAGTIKISRPTLSWLLSQAFYYLIAASVFRALASVIEALLSSFSQFG
jgi:hypothetical protein